MPVVRPFRGLRYDPAVVGSIQSVVAPPYDVIGRDEQDRLYEASPYNVIRLDFARESDRYGVASRTFAEWRDRGVLVRDREAAFYLYSQRHRLKSGEEHERRGFFARLRLEAGVILLEPIVRLTIRVQSDRVGDVMSDLNTRRAHVHGVEPAGAFSIVEAEAPLATVQRYSVDLRSITQGRGSFTVKRERYAEVPAHVQEQVLRTLVAAEA